MFLIMFPLFRSVLHLHIFHGSGLGINNSYGVEMLVVDFSGMQVGGAWGE